MNLEEFHIQKIISFDSMKTIQLDRKELPFEKVNGDLVDVHRKKFATITPHSVAYEGGYGVLTKAKRIDSSGNTHSIMIKEPKGSTPLTSEALIQHLARKTLEKYGLESAIPKVYDIFTKDEVVSFTMEFVHGCFPYEFIQKSLSPDIVFLQIIAQVAILCFLLQKDIFLDHRDLKANNLYIRKKNIKYELNLGTQNFSLNCPFQVVLLDFGFACLGDTKGISKLNLAQTAMPSLDPCPKFGRDLFHLLTSLWSIPSLREKMTEPLQKEVDSWLVYDGSDYRKLIQKYNRSDWAYIFTGLPTFTYPILDSKSILQRIHSKFPDVLKSF
jgi:serine/threonine protein kinase